MRDMNPSVRKALIAFAVGVVAIAACCAIALGATPMRIVRIGVPGVSVITARGPNGNLALIDHDGTMCQSGEVLPAKATAVRLSIWGFFGSRLHVKAYQGSQLLTEGTRSPTWTSDTVTVPVKPLKRSYSNVKFCVIIAPNSEPMDVLGNATKPNLAAVLTQWEPGQPKSKPSVLPGRLGVEYLAPSHGTWWSRLLSVARHLGLGRAYSGTWIALLIAALMAAVAVLAVRLTLRELR
jgi:hypothetical protein